MVHNGVSTALCEQSLYDILAGCWALPHWRLWSLPSGTRGEADSYLIEITNHSSRRIDGDRGDALPVNRVLDKGRAERHSAAMDQPNAMDVESPPSTTVTGRIISSHEEQAGGGVDRPARPRAPLYRRPPGTDCGMPSPPAKSISRPGYVPCCASPIRNHNFTITEDVGRPASISGMAVSSAPASSPHHRSLRAGSK